MANNIIESDSIVAINEEAIEGTYDAPASATDGYFQPKKGGIEIKAAVESLERDILTAGLAKVKSRPGMHSATAKIPTEIKGSGTEGTPPDYLGIMIKSLLGTVHAISANVTTKAAGNTQTNLKIEDADISKFAVNDLIVVKQSGEHRVHAVTAVDSTGGSANIEVLPGRAAGSFSNSVVISKSTTYKPADSGHPSMSLSKWDANEILRKALGLRTKSMSLENFTTGQLPGLSFDLEGMDHGEVDGVAPHTPTYLATEPPVILSCPVLINGVEVIVNDVQLSIEQSLSFLKATYHPTGRVKGRASGQPGRVIKGQLAPYKDDTSVAYYTSLAAGTSFSLLFSCQIPSSTAGEFEMGSVFAIWLPQCRIVEKDVDNLDGVLRDVLSFEAHGGVNGTTPEVAVAFI